MWLWLWLLGCGPADEPPPTPEEQEAERARQQLERARSARQEAGRRAVDNLHRVGHVERTRSALRAAVRGDLEQSRQDLQWIADHVPADEIPLEAAPALERTLAAGARGGQAQRLDQATYALGQIAVQCSACHAALGARPRADLPPVPDPDEATHAEVYTVALEQLWSSLATAHPDLWRIGVETLQLKPIDAADSLFTLAASGVPMLDPSDRAVVFGRFASRCGECHIEHGVHERDR